MKSKLMEDIKNAMRAGDKVQLGTLRGLQAEIKKFEIDSKTEVDEAKFVAFVRKEIKKRQDALGFAEQAARADLIDQNKQEIKILEAYLGDQLSAKELEDLVKNIVQSGASNLGQVMGALNKDHKGKFDGKLASEIAKGILG